MDLENLNVQQFEENLAHVKSILEKSHLPSLASVPPGKTTFERMSICNVRRFRKHTDILLGPGFSLIYAPNGVGKTTLTDSLELIRKGVTPRGKAYSVNAVEVKDGENLISWGAEKEDAYAELKTTSGAVYRWDKVESEQVKAAVPAISISRLNLRAKVEAKPRERFDFVRSLLPERDFGHEIDEAQRLVDELKGQLNAADECIEQLGIAAENVDLTIDGNFFHELQARIENSGGGVPVEIKKRSDLRALGKTVSSLVEEFSAIELGAKPELKSQEPSSPDATESLLLIRNLLPRLEDGQECPLCLDGELSQSRLDVLQEELRKHDSYLTAKEKYDEEKLQYEESLKSWRTERNRLEELLKRFYSLGFENHGCPKVQSLTSAELRGYGDQARTVLLRESQMIRDEIDEISQNQSVSNHDSLKTLWDSLISWGADVHERTRRIEACLGIRSRKSELEEAESGLKRLKDEIVDALLQRVKEPVLGWWQILSPDNIDFDLDFSVKDQKSSGIDIYCVPRVYSAASKKAKRRKKHAMGALSESQIDLLSMAFNLATLQVDIGQGLVWLDDPSDSFDEHNVENFIRKVIPKLLEEGHQVVLCTHSRAIVKKAWESYSSIVQPLHPEFTREEAFRQLTLDVEPASSADGLLNFEVVCLPFDLESAIKAFKADIESVDRNTGEIYRLGTRLRLANSLRRVWEFCLAEVLDSLNPLLPVPRQRSMPAIQDPQTTLGEYRKMVFDDIDVIVGRLKSHPGDDSFINRREGILISLDCVLNNVCELDAAILNEGSHASVVVPEFREISDDWSSLLKLRNQLILPSDEGQSGRTMISKLQAFYPGGKCEHFFDEVYAES